MHLECQSPITSTEEEEEGSLMHLLLALLLLLASEIADCEDRVLPLHYYHRLTLVNDRVQSRRSAIVRDRLFYVFFVFFPVFFFSVFFIYRISVYKKFIGPIIMTS